MANYTLQVSSLGADAGPFTITDNLNNVLATSVSASSLLAGTSIAISDPTAASVIVTSTGNCTNSSSVSLPVTTTTTASPTTTTTTLAPATDRKYAVSNTDFPDSATACSSSTSGGTDVYATSTVLTGVTVLFTDANLTTRFIPATPGGLYLIGKVADGARGTGYIDSNGNVSGFSLC